MWHNRHVVVGSHSYTKNLGDRRRSTPLTRCAAHTTTSPLDSGPTERNVASSPATPNGILPGMSAHRRCLILGLLALLLGGCAIVPETPPLSIVVEPLTAASFRLEAPFGWVTYSWTLGDGSTADGRTLEHTYEERGTYTIDLKATGLDGQVGFAHRTVEIGRDLYVEDGGLQSAIDAAEPGDWIFLGGEFDETAFVDKAITLVGPCTLGTTSADSPRSEDPVLLVATDGVVLKNIAFRSETDAHLSRGILRIVSAEVFVSGCSFEQISGAVGSAVHLTASGGRFERCTFSENEASIEGGAVYSIESNPLFVDCTFADNEADIDGGAVYCEGDTAFPSFEACTFTGNRAEVGGAIAARAATTVALDATPLRVEGCTFVNNIASGTLAGGAIHVGHSVRTLLIDNTFSANGPEDVVFE
jgi:hypothetical protein